MVNHGQKALISLNKFQKSAGKKTSSYYFRQRNSNSRWNITTLFSKSSKRHTRFGSDDNGNTWFITETPTSPGDESKLLN